mmetsp:Transcript_4082/g.7091  ORF Transcript_4082/g.7091 Transcript_4082/m.7091 type:complete len:293 (+) Transcript_4082:129-1007(+)
MWNGSVFLCVMVALLSLFQGVKADATYPPTQVPTEAPTEVPTEVPTEAPTPLPTMVPTEYPTPVPSVSPSPFPSTRVGSSERNEESAVSIRAASAGFIGVGIAVLLGFLFFAHRMKKSKADKEGLAPTTPKEQPRERLGARLEARKSRSPDQVLTRQGWRSSGLHEDGDIELAPCSEEDTKRMMESFFLGNKLPYTIGEDDYGDDDEEKTGNPAMLTIFESAGDELVAAAGGAGMPSQSEGESSLSQARDSPPIDSQLSARMKTKNSSNQGTVPPMITRPLHRPDKVTEYSL